MDRLGRRLVACASLARAFRWNRPGNFTARTFFFLLIRFFWSGYALIVRCVLNWGVGMDKGEA
jgi:hypothetical protein